MYEALLLASTSFVENKRNIRTLACTVWRVVCSVYPTRHTHAQIQTELASKSLAVAEQQISKTITRMRISTLERPSWVLLNIFGWREKKEYISVHKSAIANGAVRMLWIHLFPFGKMLPFSSEHYINRLWYDMHHAQYMYFTWVNRIKMMSVRTFWSLLCLVLPSYDVRWPTEKWYA